MRDPFITSINAQRAAFNWFEELTLNASNMYTPGYRERRFMFSDFMNGTMLEELPYNQDQGKVLPGRAPTNMAIEGKGMFVVRKPDGQELYTRLGDFKFDANGTFINELGYKLQGYLTDEKGNVIKAGNGQAASTEINLWVDPSNGKLLGKYDEWKVKADGTVLGVANKGQTAVPLYKVGLVQFVNPEGLTQTEDNYFVANAESGPPVEGSGEIQSGLLEKSNVFMRQTANYLQMAKTQLDITSKLISTNKNLIQESLRLIQ